VADDDDREAFDLVHGIEEDALTLQERRHDQEENEGHS
jgi:hypothetical protein